MTRLFAILFIYAVPAFVSLGQSKVVITNLVEQHKLGRTFVDELLSLRPATNSSMKGVMKIRDAKGITTNIPIRFETSVINDGWQALYRADFHEGSNKSFHDAAMAIVIFHSDKMTNDYKRSDFTYAGIHDPQGDVGIQNSQHHTDLKSTDVILPFVGSDFWLADLGLEFLYWPEQRMVSREMKSMGGVGISCKVIESINPNPATNSYSQVKSWIRFEGAEAGAPPMVYAEAFDAKGKLLKEFKPKQVEKINGEYRLREM